MLTAEQLKAYARQLSIPACGVCSAERDELLFERLSRRRERYPLCSFEEADIEKRVNPKLLMPSAQSIFVCLFPYYIGSEKTCNLARFAFVRDYHAVAGQYLENIAAFVRANVPGASCRILCDTDPLSDRQLAYRAGLGFYGKNHMLIHPLFGSYFCIGSLLLDIPLEPDEPSNERCIGCDACIRACPGHALEENFGFHCERCISYITQKKEITDAQAQLLQKQSSVYGCDICQAVCPHNRHVPQTPISEFYIDILSGLSYEQLSSVSGRGFKRLYEAYAFSWCSRQTLLKNFSKETDDGDSITGRQL